MSIAPFSSRNSARWKPSGSFSRTVCSITRAPAKPIRAPGSAIWMSPSLAKEAVTPPVVGSAGLLHQAGGDDGAWHLHQADRPFHHAGAARRGEHDQW